MCLAIFAAYFGEGVMKARKQIATFCFQRGTTPTALRVTCPFEWEVGD